MDQVITINVTIRDNGETSVQLLNGVVDRGSLVAFAAYFQHLANSMTEIANQTTLH